MPCALPVTTTESPLTTPEMTPENQPPFDAFALIVLAARALEGTQDLERAAGGRFRTGCNRMTRHAQHVRAVQSTWVSGAFLSCSLASPAWETVDEMGDS